MKKYFVYSMVFISIFISATEGANLIKQISPKLSAALSLNASNCAKDPTIGVKALGMDSLNSNCLKVTQRSLKNEIKVSPNFASIVSRWDEELKSDYINLIAMRLDNPKIAPASLTIEGQSFLDAVDDLQTRIQQSTDLNSGISISASNCAQNLQKALRAALSTGSNPNCIKTAMKQMDPNQPNSNREYIYLFNLFTEDEKNLMRRLFVARSGNLGHDLNNTIAEIKSRNLLNSPIFKLYTITRTSNRFTCGYGGLDDIKSLLKPAYNINCWLSIQKNKDKITRKLHDQFGEKVVKDFTNLLQARLSLKADLMGTEISPQLWETTIVPLLELIGISVPKHAAKASMPVSEPTKESSLKSPIPESQIIPTPPSLPSLVPQVQQEESTPEPIPAAPVKKSGGASGQSKGVQSGQAMLVRPPINPSTTPTSPPITGEGSDEAVDIEGPFLQVMEAIAPAPMEEISPTIPPQPVTMVVRKKAVDSSLNLKAIRKLFNRQGQLQVIVPENAPQVVQKLKKDVQDLTDSLIHSMGQLKLHPEIQSRDPRELFFREYHSMLPKWIAQAKELKIQAKTAKVTIEDPEIEAVVTPLETVVTAIQTTLTPGLQLAIEGPKNMVVKRTRGGASGVSSTHEKVESNNTIISPLKIPRQPTVTQEGGDAPLFMGGVQKGEQKVKIANTPAALVVPDSGSGETSEETFRSPVDQFEDDVKALVKDTATEADLNNKTLDFTNVEQLTTRQNKLLDRLKTLKISSQKQIHLELMLHEVHLNLITASTRLWARIEVFKGQPNGKVIESQALQDLNRDMTSLLQSAKTSSPNVAGDFIKLEDLYRRLHTYAEFKSNKTQFKFLGSELDSIRSLLNSKKGNDIRFRVSFERNLNSLYSDAVDLNEGSSGEITAEKISTLEQRKSKLEDSLKSPGLSTAPEIADWKITMEVIEDELTEVKSKLPKSSSVTQPVKVVASTPIQNPLWDKLTHDIVTLLNHTEDEDIGGIKATSDQLDSLATLKKQKDHFNDAPQSMKDQWNRDLQTIQAVLNKKIDKTKTSFENDLKSLETGVNKLQASKNEPEKEQISKILKNLDLLDSYLAIPAFENFFDEENWIKRVNQVRTILEDIQTRIKKGWNSVPVAPVQPSAPIEVVPEPVIDFVPGDVITEKGEREWVALMNAMNPKSWITEQNNKKLLPVGFIEKFEKTLKNLKTQISLSKLTKNDVEFLSNVYLFLVYVYKEATTAEYKTNDQYGRNISDIFKEENRKTLNIKLSSWKTELKVVGYRVQSEDQKYGIPFENPSL